jgi:DNA-binding beta-propeller fold protein YncE
MGSDGTPTGNKFCPSGNQREHSLKHVALDPTNSFFYVTDTKNNTVHRVSLKTWKSTGNFTVPLAPQILGLLVLRSIDQAAFQAGRKQAEQDWLAAVSTVRQL